MRGGAEVGWGLGSWFVGTVIEGTGNGVIQTRVAAGRPPPTGGRTLTQEQNVYGRAHGRRHHGLPREPFPCVDHVTTKKLFQPSWEKRARAR